MDLFTRADLRALLAGHEGPCVLFYMPAQPGVLKESRIRFKDLLGPAERHLVEYGLRAPEARDLLAPLHALLDDDFFWLEQAGGLAVFQARNFLRMYRLPWAFREESKVGGLFLVEPLLPLLYGDGRFYVLAFSKNGVRLFQGTRFTASPVAVKGMPKDLAEILALDKEEVFTAHRYPTAAAGGAWGFHGHEAGTDDRKDDLLRYFQRIDRALHAVLREERAPLVLAAVEYLQPIYRQASTYPHLLEQGIEGSPDRLDAKELHDRAWALVGPHFQENVRKAVALYPQAAAAGKATADVNEIIPAAYHGQFEILFVAPDEHPWGTLDPDRDAVTLHEAPQPGDEDLANFAAIHTLAHGATVYALPAQDMPAESPLAGIYHLPLPKHAGKRA